MYALYINKINKYIYYSLNNLYKLYYNIYIYIYIYIYIININ